MLDRAIIDKIEEEIVEFEEFTLFPVTRKKRPLVKFRHLEYADRSTVSAQDYGWALATGQRSGGIVVVDVDVKGGKRGLESLAEMPPLPETFTVRTPSGGLHYYFVTTEQISNSVSSIAPDIDIRGDGGFVVFPGTPGYTIEHMAPIADLPSDWLLKMSIRQNKDRAPKSSLLQKTIEDLAKTCKGFHNPYARSWRAVANGARFARASGSYTGPDVGPVNNHIWHMMCWLSDQGDWCHVDPTCVAKLMTTSLSLLQADDEAQGNDVFTLQDMEEMYERATEEARALFDIKQAFDKLHEEGPEPSPSPLAGHLMQHKNQFYVKTPEGYFSGPYIDKEVVHAARQLGLNVNQRTKTGSKMMSVNALMEVYGVILSEIKLHLDLEETCLETVTEPNEPIRYILHINTTKTIKTKPFFYPQIDEWLTLLGGEKLKDWIAVARDLDYAAPALWFTGEPGVGKSLVGAGLSRLWGRNNPVSLATALHRFNGGIKHCPIIAAEEAMPKDLRGNPKWDELKVAISQTSRTIEDKYGGTYYLQGALRIIMSSNNLDMIQSREELTKADVSALAQRLIHIDIPSEKGAHLRQMLQEIDVQSLWLDSGRLASHFQWLIENRDPSMGDRLRLPPSSAGIVKALNTRLGGGFYVCKTLYDWILEEAKKVKDDRPRSSYQIGWKAGAVHCMNSAIYNRLDLDRNNMTKRTLSSVLKRISSGYRSTSINGVQRFRYIIELDNIISWCENEGTGWGDMKLLSEAAKVLDEEDGRRRTKSNAG